VAATVSPAPAAESSASNSRLASQAMSMQSPAARTSWAATGAASDRASAVAAVRRLIFKWRSPDWVQWTGAARDANPASIPNSRRLASDHAAVPGRDSHRPARPGRAIWDNRGHAGVVPAWSRDEGAFARVGAGMAGCDRAAWPGGADHPGGLAAAPARTPCRRPGMAALRRAAGTGDRLPARDHLPDLGRRPAAC